MRTQHPPIVDARNPENSPFFSLFLGSSGGPSHFFSVFFPERWQPGCMEPRLYSVFRLSSPLIASSGSDWESTLVVPRHFLASSQSVGVIFFGPLAMFGAPMSLFHPGGSTVLYSAGCCPSQLLSTLSPIFRATIVARFFVFPMTRNSRILVSSGVVRKTGNAVEVKQSANGYGNGTVMKPPPVSR